MDPSPTPIHHIPYEMLVEIFRLFISSCGDNLAQTTIPARTCNRWRQIILSTPELHSTFTFNLDETRPGYSEYILLLVQRSRQYPLCLRLIGRFAQENKRALSEIFNARPRWKSVRISIDREMYVRIRMRLTKEMPLLVSLEVVLSHWSLGPRNGGSFRDNFPPLPAPNLRNLDVSHFHHGLFERSSVSWDILDRFRAPIGSPDHLFRVLTWGKSLTECSVSGHAFIPPSSPSPWEIPPIISHASLRVLSLRWTTPITPCSIGSLLTRLTLPSLIDLTISAFDSCFLPTLPPFLHRSGRNLHKFCLSPGNTEDRGLSTIFKETPQLKELVLDTLQTTEIQQLMDETLNLLPELEIFEVWRIGGRRSVLDMVHALVVRRMMVDVDVEGEIVPKPLGKLKRFSFKHLNSSGLFGALTSQVTEWDSANQMKEWHWQWSLFKILEKRKRLKTPISDEDQMAVRDILMKVKSTNPTGLALFHSGLPNYLLRISSLGLTLSSPDLALPGGDKYAIIPLAKTLLEDQCKPKLKQYIDWFSKEPIVVMVTGRQEVRYQRIVEEEHDTWHTTLTRDAWSCYPEATPLPFVFEYAR